MMPFSPKIVGNPKLPAIHGGMTGSFLETTAIVGVNRELKAAAPPKPIGLKINYSRSGRALDSYGNVSRVPFVWVLTSRERRVPPRPSFHPMRQKRADGARSRSLQARRCQYEHAYVAASPGIRISGL
jgi:hypothetical protein